MKIIAFDRRPDAAFVCPPAIELISDSALVNPRQPLFLPDFDTEWEARLCGVYRVSRLGKTIPENFAHRYLDAFSLAFRLVPVTTDRMLRERSMPAGIEGLFDSAMAIGQWIEIGDENSAGNLTVSSGGLDETVMDHFTMACRALETVSRYATVKTGDVISPWWMPAGVIPQVGGSLAAALNGHECLNVKIR